MRYILLASSEMHFSSIAVISTNAFNNSAFQSLIWLRAQHWQTLMFHQWYLVIGQEVWLVTAVAIKSGAQTVSQTVPQTVAVVSFLHYKYTH